MQARAVAAHWSGTPLELKPHPDEESDFHSVLVLGHPGEWVLVRSSPVGKMTNCLCRFQYAERLLSLIGEGGPEEVDDQGRWGAWPAWKQQIREAID